MSIYAILIVLFIHWIGDFVLQTDEMAQGKSKNWCDLLNHTFLYSVVFLIPAMFIIGINSNIKDGYEALGYGIAFSSITFICHTAQDYYTSRVNAKLWEEKKVHQFFVSIGFDQFLHFVQLILTCQLLIK